MNKNYFPNIHNEINISDEAQILYLQDIIKNNYIVLDIGCGHGDFIIDQATKYPEKYFIGIEVSRKRAFKTGERLYKRNIKNFSIISYDGDAVLKLVFPENSVNEIHINFPDPWLKKKQWKNRLIKPSFVVQVIRILRSKGKLYFVSDVEEYANEVAELLKKFKELKSYYNRIIEKNLYKNFPTLYYNKMSGLRDINYICFEKI